MGLRDITLRHLDRWSGEPPEWQERARRVEALGYDVLLTADHLVDDAFPPLLPLVSAADVTERLRVGTYVVNNDFRHPVVLAREAAALGVLTDGRFLLGLGAGHMRSSTTRPASRSTAAGCGSTGSRSRSRSCGPCSTARR